MSEPIVFISRSTVNEGGLEGFTELFGEAARTLEAEKPGTVMYLAYVGDDGRELTIVHAFPDADAMDLHLQGVAQRAQRAFEFIETKGYEIYGAPSETTLETMRTFASSGGVPLSVQSEHVGGYLRTGSG